MNYVYTPIKNKNYVGILTILDYEDPISSCVINLYQEKGIPKENKSILIDGLLRVGTDKFRFMSFKNSNDGSSRHFEYRKDLDKALVEEADDILMKYPEIIRNSILSLNKKERYLKDWSYCDKCHKFFKINPKEIWTDIVAGDPYQGCLTGEFINCPECNSVIEIIPYTYIGD